MRLLNPNQILDDLALCPHFIHLLSLELIFTPGKWEHRSGPYWIVISQVHVLPSSLILSFCFLIHKMWVTLATSEMFK